MVVSSVVLMLSALLLFCVFVIYSNVLSVENNIAVSLIRLVSVVSVVDVAV